MKTITHLKKFFCASLLLISTLLFNGCSDADVASRNISVGADNFEIFRRVVFYNGITDTYLLTIEGYCSLDNVSTEKKIAITCKTSPTDYKKHYLGLSDNVTYFVEQLEPAKTGISQYRVVFKPLTIIPDIEIRK